MDEDILHLMKSLFRDIQRNYFQDDERPLSQTQVEIMHYICCHNNVIFQKDLEKVLNISRATVSEVLKTMEKNNLIERKVNDNDLRSKKILITDYAKTLFKNKRENMRRLNSIITKDITSHEKDVFINVINKMKRNIKEDNL